MPRVVIESKNQPTLEVDAPRGGSLADLCDEHASAVPFSCRSANCGTCRIDVIEGMELLTEPQDDELDVLDIFGDDPKKRRLCCQAKMKADAGADESGVTGGTLRIRPVDEY